MSISPESIEAYDPIPRVVHKVEVGEEQVVPGYGHVPIYGLDKMYFDEMMRIMDERGIGLETIRERGFVASVGEIHNKPLRDLKAGDSVTIITDAKERDTSIEFNQAMQVREKPAGSNTLVVDFRSGRNRPMVLPDWIREGLRKQVVDPEIIDESEFSLEVLPIGVEKNLE
jgi:acyl-CoA thioesterase FadM